MARKSSKSKSKSKSSATGSNGSANGWQQTEAGQQLQERLTSEHTILALTRLLDRIDGLEQTVQTLVTTIEQGPGFVSMVADTVDEAYSQANESGVDLEMRLKAGLAMADKLTAPKTVAVLDKLLDRVDQVEQLVEMADQAPGMISMVADTADEAYRQAAQSGVDIEARLKAGASLADKLLSRADQLEQLILVADQAPGMISMVADTADEAYRQAAASGVDIEARLKAGASLADKLLSRADQLEQLILVADQAPGMISMVADVADETYRQAAQSGIDIEARLKAGANLADKLLSRADQLEQLILVADQAPGMISMVADIADETYRQAAQSGVDIEARLSASLLMIEKLTAPETMEVLSALLSRTDKLGQAVELIDQGPGLAAMAMDTLDEAYHQALMAGIDIDSLVSQGLSLSAILANFVSSKEFQSLQHSGVLDPNVLKVVGSAGQALVTTQQQAIKPVGLFDLVGAIRDPNMQRALGFLLAFGRNFGQSL